MSVYRQLLALVESEGQSAGWYSWTASFWVKREKKIRVSYFRSLPVHNSSLVRDLIHKVVYDGGGSEVLMTVSIAIILGRTTTLIVRRQPTLGCLS